MKLETIDLQTTRSQHSKLANVDWNNLPFGQVFTDHMLVMNYRKGSWQNPEIVPFDSISMHPATSALHYGQSIFEGLKAFKRKDGDVVLFRPELNAKRFVESCSRMCMPPIDPQLFVELVENIVDIDRAWIPQKQNYALYIRPFLFGTDHAIGIRPSDNYTFIIFLCPVGSYYSQEVNIKIEEQYVRAAPGGVGRAKTAGNYAASMYPAKIGLQEGYHQLLWTDANEHRFIEEVGTMNICFVINGTLVTPSEDQDTILCGTTKRTIIELAHQWDVPVEERKVSVQELVIAIENGQLQEAFGAGTAATIAPIAKIGFRGKDLIVPKLKEDSFATKATKYLNSVKLGEVKDENKWCRIVTPKSYI